MNPQQQQILNELRRYKDRQPSLPLFTFNGVDIHDPFYDESYTVELDNPIDYYGIDNIALALSKLMKYERMNFWPQPTKLHRELIIRHIEEFRLAARKLAMVWEQEVTADEERMMAAGYPFDKSFDELVDDIDKWKEAVEREMFSDL